MGLDPNRGAVAAGHKATAEAAVEILRAGGNAFDAIVAGLWAACVCEPVLAAPGGGGFLMAHEGDTAGSGTGDKARLFDFFCNAPRVRRDPGAIEFAEVFADFGATRQAFHIGAGAAAAPGFVAGIEAVHASLCTMAMTDLIVPAVALAKGGVSVTPFQAYLFDVVTPILTWTEQARAIFAPGGDLLRAGETMTNPALGEALTMIAEGRQDSIRQAMLEECETYRGHLRADDLDLYRVAERRPVELAIGDVTIWLNPPPALGGVLAGAMLADYAAAPGPRSAVQRAGSIAKIDSAWRRDGAAISKILGLSGDGGAGDKAAGGPGTGNLAVRGTTHISVIDAEGRAASATVTNGEGNGRILGEFGFMLNNMLGEADLNPGGFHNWRPGARLSSMMAPTIARLADGTLIALGSGGSNRIRTAIFQALAGRLLEGMTPAEAVAAPRLHLEDGRLDIEAGEEWDEREALLDTFPGAKAWPERSLYFGGVHWAEAGPGGYAGAGDPRRDGVFLIA
jgi:gamma-glutamyltranspeptidase/glutathione hydrolase